MFRLFTAACWLWQCRSCWERIQQLSRNCDCDCDWWPGYLQLPLPGEQLLVSLLELVLPLLGVQVLDQLGLGGHGRRTLARPPHQAARPLELQHEIFFL